jgi:hypothetical protein
MMHKDQQGQREAGDEETLADTVNQEESPCPRMISVPYIYIYNVSCKMRSNIIVCLNHNTGTR